MHINLKNNFNNLIGYKRWNKTAGLIGSGSIK